MANSFLAGVKGDAIKIAHRSALANNGKSYNGTNAYDTVSSWNQIERTSPFSVLFAINRNSGSSGRLLDTRYNQAATDRGMAVFGDGSTLGLLLRNNLSGNNISAFSTFGLKTGKNIGIITYDGSSLNTGIGVHINGRQAIGGTISRAGTLTGTIVNSENRLLIATGAFPSLPPYDLFTGIFRKAQIVNRVLTSQEIRAGFNFGTLEDIVEDADFLLDVDFNKTGTTDLTTRSGTPTYTITPTGAESFASFY